MAIRNHSQADDLRARFKVPEWGVFCHTERLRNSPPRLKLVLSDSTIEVVSDARPITSFSAEARLTLEISIPAATANVVVVFIS